MNLRQLRYFVTVAEELHFGRAADRLHITQPPLSQAILALEAEVQVSLFRRTRRSVALTPVGRAWLAYVRRLLEDAAALPGIALRLSRGEIGLLNLAFVSTADYSVLPLIVRHYKELFPGVDLFLKEATSDIQVDSLLNGEIDAGLIISPLPATLPASFQYRPLLREPLVAAVSDAWIARNRHAGESEGIALKDVLSEPLILFPRRSAPSFHDIITGYYARNGAQPWIRQQAIQMQTIISLVSAGIGIALVPQSLRNLARMGVSYLTLEDTPPQVETGLIWRGDDLSPALAQFVEIATSQARKLGEQQDNGGREASAVP